MNSTSRTLSTLLIVLSACGGTSTPPATTTTPADPAQLTGGGATAEAALPAGMVRIGGGTFELGSSTGDSIERPAHSVTLSPYFISRTEVTVLAYRECHAAGQCGEPNPWDELERPYCNWGASGREAHPINCLDWPLANSYCRYIGARLPSEAEWEFAARGATGRTFPWGSEAPDDTRLWWSATTPREGTTTVGSFPAGASPFGVLDLSGNVLEWIDDWHGAFTGGAAVDPRGPDFGETRGVRGGGWQAIRPEWVRSTMRDGDDPSARSDDLGFRCARSARVGAP